MLDVRSEASFVDGDWFSIVWMVAKFFDCAETVAAFALLRQKKNGAVESDSKNSIRIIRRDRFEFSLMHQKRPETPYCGFNHLACFGVQPHFSRQSKQRNGLLQVNIGGIHIARNRGAFWLFDGWFFLFLTLLFSLALFVICGRFFFRLGISCSCCCLGCSKLDIETVRPPTKCNHQSGFWIETKLFRLHIFTTARVPVSGF